MAAWHIRMQECKKNALYKDLECKEIRMKFPATDVCEKDNGYVKEEDT